MKKLFRGGIALALLAILMATFTIKLNAASEYIFMIMMNLIFVKK